MLQQTTIDPTQQSLEAAILDQKVAGMQMFEEMNHRPALPPGQLWPIAAVRADEDDGTEIEFVYLDRPENQSWKDRTRGGDSDKARRRAVTDALVKRFGPWRGLDHASDPQHS